MYKIYPDLTKDYVFQYVTQEEIFSRYLGVQIPNDPSEYIVNPLRKDINPTVSFKWFGNKLRMKDWSGYFYGDCFDLVAFILGVSVNNQFYLVLEDICRTFSLRDYAQENKELIKVNSSKLDTKLKINSNKAKVIYKFIAREYNLQDKNYWESYKFITKGILNLCKVSPVKLLYRDNNVEYVHNYKDLCYAYEDNGTFQFYFPLRRKHQTRFISTDYSLKFLELVTGNKNILVITKSRKDAMCLTAVVRLLNLSVDVIYVPAENYILTENDLTTLEKLNYNIRVTLFDNDFTGKNLAFTYLKLFDMHPLIIRSAKDFSSLCKNNSKKLILELTKKTYELLMYKSNVRNNNQN